MRILRAVVLALLTSACFSSDASASQAAKLKIGFEPNRLGASTTLVFGFTLTADESGPPSPLVSVSLHFPAGIAYATSTLGEAGCDPRLLAERGVRGCPTNSRIGLGKAQVEVPLGPTLLTETVGITTFVGRSENDRIEVLYYAAGNTPVIARLVFPGELISEAVGGKLDTAIPLIQTLPEAPDASVVKLTSTIGPKHLFYTTTVHGKRVRYHPRGIILPAICPQGGFAFSAAFRFANGSTTSARSVVRCSRSKRRGG
jgi:hypothetical protein